MATEAKVSAPKATAKKSDRKVPTRYTEEELLKMDGKKGKVLLFIRKAFAISRKAEFKMTEWEGREASSVTGHFYSKINPNGVYFGLDEKSEDFLAILAAAKDAQLDIVEKKNSKKVATLLNLVIGLRKEAGAREISTDILKDIKL